jgi:hypothetical protein
MDDEWMINGWWIWWWINEEYVKNNE